MLEVAGVLGGLRSVLGLKPDRRADLIQAFAAERSELEELHAAIGRVIGMCDKQARARG